jgi:hypothetical protein
MTLDTSISLPTKNARLANRLMPVALAAIAMVGIATFRTIGPGTHDVGIASFVMILSVGATAYLTARAYRKWRATCRDE